MKPEAKEPPFFIFSKGGWDDFRGEKKKLLYHVSTANQEYLAFGL